VFRGQPLEEAKELRNFAFPVVVGDGRRLTIEWREGDEPVQVAWNFAAQHGISDEELPTIIAFVEHANKVTADVSA